MPHRLKDRKTKIQAKRKTTPWRQFVMEICSWMPVSFHKIDGQVSRFPQTGREGNIVSIQAYNPEDSQEGIYIGNFFESLTTLFKENPKMIVQQWFENENSEYSECYAAKNCYLSFGVGQNAENIIYSASSCSNIRNVIGSFGVMGGCDNIFDSKAVTGSYNVFYSANIHSSDTIWFSRNLIGCSHCIACEGLENQSYCIKNKQYTKEEYNTVSSGILSEKLSFQIRGDKTLSAPLDNKNSENVQGSAIMKSKNIENGYYCNSITNGRNIFIGGGEESGSEFYDAFQSGNQTDKHLYGTYYVGETSSHAYCVAGGGNITNCFYSYHIESCSYCLGCVGLRNKSYCIFNKQYTKQERYEKVDNIFSKMEAEGILGQFFPGSMNPLYFNDTAAYLIDDSFTKQEVEAAGYLRRDEESKVDIPEWMNAIDVNDLGDYEGFDNNGQRTIDPTILKKVIRDEFGNSYRIIKMEYDFLVKHELPLPRKHRLQRLKSHFSIA